MAQDRLLTMAPHRKALRPLLTTALFLLMGLLVLQALGYGIGFFIDPSSGVGEFGTEPPAVGDDLTVALVGLVGVGMLGVAALLVLAAILVWRANPDGAYVAMIVGGCYILAGVSAARAGWSWDAYFYSVTGGLLVFLSAAVRWVQSLQTDQGR